MGDRGAEAGGIGGAVNVDVAGAGVGVVRFESVQGEDAGEDDILHSLAGMRMKTHRRAGAENGIQRGVFAVFGVDAEAPQGGASAAFFAAGAVCPGAAWCGKEERIVIAPHLQQLSRYIYVNPLHQ